VELVGGGELDLASSDSDAAPFAGAAAEAGHADSDADDAAGAAGAAEIAEIREHQEGLRRARGADKRAEAAIGRGRKRRSGQVMAPALTVGDESSAKVWFECSYLQRAVEGRTQTLSCEDVDVFEAPQAVAAAPGDLVVHEDVLLFDARSSGGGAVDKERFRIGMVLNFKFTG
jgi:hypothetical protein